MTAERWTTVVAAHAPIVGTAPAPASPAPLLAVWPDEAATQRFAARLATLPALRDAVVTLHGPLGAGKTTFVRHLLQALGVEGRIKSPTYAVVEPHEGAGGLAVHHFDFYRFADPREYEDAGFRDTFAAPGLKLAEWPEKAGALLPPADLSLVLAVHDDGKRQVHIDAGTPRGAALLQALMQAPGPALAE